MRFKAPLGWRWPARGRTHPDPRIHPHRDWSTRGPMTPPLLPTRSETGTLIACAPSLLASRITWKATISLRAPKSADGGAVPDGVARAAGLQGVVEVILEYLLPIVHGPYCLQAGRGLRRGSEEQDQRQGSNNTVQLGPRRVTVHRSATAGRFQSGSDCPKECTYARPKRFS